MCCGGGRTELVLCRVEAEWTELADVPLWADVVNGTNAATSMNENERRGLGEEAIGRSRGGEVGRGMLASAFSNFT